MGLGGWLFASLYDRILSGTESAGLSQRRARLLASASGQVLEVGAGTGLNLPHYTPQVVSLTLEEPEPHMARRLRQRLSAMGREAVVVSAPAERLPFSDAAFDTVVSTLVLCTVGDLAAALREIRRVLKPGGRLLFMEHVRADDLRTARWQDRLNGLNRVVAHGCNCNRSTLDAIASAGFDVRELERGQVPKAPPFVRPLIVGAAVRSY